MKSTQPRLRVLACSLSLVVLPAVFAGDADKKFAKMDTNGDGQITRAEHTTGAQRMFAELDADRDGVVTALEMDAKKEAKHGDKKDHAEMSAAEKIKTIDQNGDGRLTAAEHAAGSDTMFAKMDANGDGALSKEECDTGHKTMKKNKRD
ncbi:MAG TPA: hypothetical protein VEQ65_08660 [Opitutus sp.]|nr:hypothetical protein [Opitutus sp.]